MTRPPPRERVLSGALTLADAASELAKESAASACTPEPDGGLLSAEA